MYDTHMLMRYVCDEMAHDVMDGDERDKREKETERDTAPATPKTTKQIRTRPSKSRTIDMTTNVIKWSYRDHGV